MNIKKPFRKRLRSHKATAVPAFDGTPKTRSRDWAGRRNPSPKAGVREPSRATASRMGLQCGDSKIDAHTPRIARSQGNFARAMSSRIPPWLPNARHVSVQAVGSPDRAARQSARWRQLTRCDPISACPTYRFYGPKVVTVCLSHLTIRVPWTAGINRYNPQRHWSASAGMSAHESAGTFSAASPGTRLLPHPGRHTSQVSTSSERPACSCCTISRMSS